ncbi:MAG: CRISPR system precrRNA processing endoribonuclease RAMP protein Cas6 [Nitrososphaerota archaeon]|nr:CRISPR system precrRNA processing endoribonuclease RAMP protein Cas6 [Nitrososphaerota archaeon]
MIVKALVKFRLLSNIVSPPFSSKISRTLLYNIFRGVENSTVIQRINEGTPHKPIIVSPLLELDQLTPKFIYKTSTCEAKPIILKEKGEYGFYLTLITKDAPLIEIVEALTPGRRVKIFTGEAVIEDCQFEMRSFESLNLQGDKIHIRFMTPTLLSFPREWIKVETPIRHSLFPIPCFITWSLAEHWNTHAPKNLKIKNPKKLAAYSNYALVELDYNVKPVTAIYDEKRRPRGFIGWTLYEHRKLRTKLSIWINRLLEYANYVGIGRSRSIGFGVAQIKIKE